ncbi:TMEM175 family protein [Streptomyces monashensis]|uniref:TMEM175 family protein n=1 Tax=Streptomyces monashensis TaxID=1678012 RepID=UPI0033D49061
MSEKNSPERLVLFTDAVVAIALTLLVLPLTDIVPELVATHRPPMDAITGHPWQIRSFLLSFLVIGRQWLSHHRLFGNVVTCDTKLITVNMLWLFTVVVLPFPTQMVGVYGTDEFTCLFYIGTVTVKSLCLTGLMALVRKNARSTSVRKPIPSRRWIDSVSSTVTLIAAFLIAAFVPGVRYLALLLLLAPSVITKLASPARDGIHRPHDTEHRTGHAVPPMCFAESIPNRPCRRARVQGRSVQRLTIRFPLRQ